MHGSCRLVLIWKSRSTCRTAETKSFLGGATMQCKLSGKAREDIIEFMIASLRVYIQWSVNFVSRTGNTFSHWHTGSWSKLVISLSLFMALTVFTFVSFTVSLYTHFPIPPHSHLWKTHALVHPGKIGVPLCVPSGWLPAPTHDSRWTRVNWYRLITNSMDKQTDRQTNWRSNTYMN